MTLIRVRGDGFELRGSYVDPVEEPGVDAAALRAMLVRYGAERTYPFWAVAFRAYAVTAGTSAALAACGEHLIVEASVTGDERVDAAWYPARILICRIEPLDGEAEPEIDAHPTSTVVTELDELEVPHE